MKKLLLVMMSVFVLASCVSGSSDVTKNEQQEEKTSGVVKERVLNVADAEMEMYRKNIVVKTMGDDYIVYEYSDVRIDKVAPLASRYCYETNPGKKAYLRDIYMHRNHKRRATFDCVDLASE